ncbi:MAG TPA: sulfite dehydrogenase [Methylophaga aminisulfidivorans]|uniref:Sulfite dehydrogenase n=1 Tax=Methylophaga thalassica TaxID=40223 RepID=A0ABQ5TXM2_9GAMM|nr:MULTISPECIES: sulfite dehydrogenase [Methylophaga]GLQ00192.1 sulfite dehydrogenase [Methylophaga thalassica]HIC46439.1 sulfite dehydrogenase [Methylophaga sp.]HIM38564.1 sulfite dehydrogenase [Methylophaga aminisulfidivorans]
MSKQRLKSRRQFLQGTALSSVFLGFSLPVKAQSSLTELQQILPESMLKPGANFSNYGQPSIYEKDIIRWISANPNVPGNGVSWTPLEELQGTITPNGLHYERHHNGVPDINPSTHEIMIDGLVDTPLTFSIDALKRYPQTTKICFIECGGNSNAGWRSSPIQSAAGYVHGLVSNAEWTGVPLRLLLNECGVQPKAKWAIAEAADGAALNVSVPIEKLMNDAILALYQNGERLRPENGYPVRLLLPGWEGIVNVKWLRQLTLVEEPAMTRDETAQYTDLLPSGKARQFSFPMQAKSLITSPSVGMTLPDNPGIYQVTGLAWSGNGKISKVDVSADGGKTWVEAELQAPILDKAFTRFSLPWQWQGQYAVLQSRATDETGYQQPTREALITERGDNSFFHYNAIVSWEVNEDGQISHIYL